MTAPVVHPRDPLHGVTLEQILNQMVQRYGWNEMADRIPIRCFQFDPSVKSSLTFLRKTPWARQKIEEWFIAQVWGPAPVQAPPSQPKQTTDWTGPMRTDIPEKPLAIVEEIDAQGSAIPRRPSPCPTVPTGARRDADETPEVLARVRTQLRDPHRAEGDGRPA